MVRHVILAVAVATAPLGAQTRFAGVRVTDVFKGNADTAAALTEIEARRKKLNEDPRNKELDALANETRQLLDQADAAAKAGDVATGQKLAREIGIKRRDLEALGHAIDEDRIRASRELDRELVRTTVAALERIRQLAAEVGKERGFDLVIDTSGNSNTGVPVVLYTKNLPDLTDEVIARLKPPPPPPPAPASPVPGAAPGAGAAPPAGPQATSTGR